jgi:hypothetical protein
MNRVIRWIFSQTKLGQFLNGKKTIIGAVLVFTSAVLEALLTIAPMFPEQPWLATTAAELQNVLKQVQPYLNDLGISLIGVGLMHKAAKNQR